MTADLGKTVAKESAGAPTNGGARLYCPECGAETETHVGLIEETVYRSLAVGYRHTRLGRFTVCTGCEWGVEGRGPGAA